MLFKIVYMIGKSERTDTIEAANLDEAEQKANERHPTWVDIVTKNPKLESLGDDKEAERAHDLAEFVQEKEAGATT